MGRPLALFAALLVGCLDPADETDGTPDTDTAPEEDPIVAGTETVTATWDVDLYSAYESPTIPRFDTKDGRRQLDGMTIAVEHAATMTLDVENASAFALLADDYAVELYLQSIIQLGDAEDTDTADEGPPFFGPGAFLSVVAVGLEASDGTEASGPDYHQETFTDEVQFQAEYDWVETPTYLDAMIGTEPLQLVVGGFSETWTYWNNDYDGAALLMAGATAIQYSGTMTVTYTYSPTEE